MEWERLIRFVLLGSSDLEPWAILLVRVALGLFFAISGAIKLFVASRRQAMYETLVEAKVPLPHLMTYFVSAVEFLGGCLVAIGLLSSLASAALLVNMLVAILTTKLSAMPKGLSPLNWLDDFLISSGSLVRALLCLADLLWTGEIQRRLVARRPIVETSQAGPSRPWMESGAADEFCGVRHIEFVDLLIDLVGRKTG
jgi:putative oxidoreductase